MSYESWAKSAITAAVDWATSPNTDIRDLQKSGFVMGAQGKALATGYRLGEMGEFDERILRAAWGAGQLWAQDNPMPATDQPQPYQP